MFDDPTRPANLARFVFLDPRAAHFYPDWDDAANTTVNLLRTEAGRDPYDKALTDLVGELATRSDDLPHPLGRPQRPPLPHRHQTLPPPRRRRPRSTEPLVSCWLLPVTRLEDAQGYLDRAMAR